MYVLALGSPTHSIPHDTCPQARSVDTNGPKSGVKSIFTPDHFSFTRCRISGSISGESRRADA